MLVVNAGLGTVTTAIVQAGMLLLHRSVDMSVRADALSGNVKTVVPLVDRESTAQEWAQQEPLGPGGWDRLRCRSCDAELDVPASKDLIISSLVRQLPNSLQAVA